MSIRPAEPQDRERIHEILAATNLFSDDEIRIAMELFDVFLTEGHPERDDYLTFVVQDAGGVVRGYVCWGPTPLTDGVYDLYWIAVDPKQHRQGLGRVLLGFVEDEVKRRDGRMLLIETSSKPSYASTARFYEQSGYIEVSRIRDYYKVDDDKVVYCKRLKQ
jgi:ribosomal protein S18 acetylase RimI-like enzyme